MRTKRIGMMSVLIVLVLATVSIAQPSRAGKSSEDGARGRRQRGGMRGEQRDFAPPPMPLMRALDTNNDGIISATEMEKAASALKKLDRNSDGDLTRDELRPSFGDRDRRGQRARGADRPDRPRRPQDDTGTSITESTAAPKDEAEKKLLDVLDDMDRNQRRSMMNVPTKDGRLLRLLTEATGAKHVVEIGTSNGYSGIWFCLALRTTGGKLTTFEIDADRASKARENFKRAGVDKMVTLNQGNAHELVTKLEESIDVLFLDADKEGYVDYLNQLLPLVRPGGLVVAHNINPRQADPKYVKAITTDPALETLFVHKDGTGVGVTLKKR
ncbi:MAG: class I SAM-dependent methyltransferase [Planctomycetota bacterium]|nr:MAG: class I SAM-dependent methyltransferase [Planctomycetota bacterium]